MVLRVKSGAINFSFKYFLPVVSRSSRSSGMLCHASFGGDFMPGFTRRKDDDASGIYLQLYCDRREDVMKVSINLLSTILE